MGLYKCYASNSQGSDRVDTFLYPVQYVFALSKRDGRSLARYDRPSVRLEFLGDSQPASPPARGRGLAERWSKAVPATRVFLQSDGLSGHFNNMAHLGVRIRYPPWGIIKLSARVTNGGVGSIPASRIVCIGSRLHLNA